MNYPSRTDETLGHEGWNQSPPRFPNDATTRQDLNGVANSRMQRDHRADVVDAARNNDPIADHDGDDTRPRAGAELGASPPRPSARGGENKTAALPVKNEGLAAATTTARSCSSVSSRGRRGGGGAAYGGSPAGFFRRVARVLTKYSKFIGPGFMVSVAYIDPGNYSTDISAGSAYRFRLLFIILMSNLFAIFLQSLCVRLGTVTGMNLAEHCKAHLPWWLNIVLYIFAESAIIATDIAEVIGSAIALNLLLKIPLVAGCAITLVDVLVILFFYRPTGSMRNVRIFEFFVMGLVLAVVVCFCIQLSYIQDTSVGEVFRGYLPSKSVVERDGLYLSCGILGATVMPHSLYLGSGVVQSRVREFDVLSGNLRGQSSTGSTNDSEPEEKYKPSYAAIKYCMNYSIFELAFSLFSFALFVNSAILIVAGASLSTLPADKQSDDLFGIYNLLQTTLQHGAGTIFALALLFSGTSAGIVCTIAGQMVSEGQLNWSVAPWMRRLITRAISITPSIIIAAAIGKNGLSDALNATQVALSVILPFVSAPLIWFTCRNKYMTVTTTAGEDGEETRRVGMRNHWVVTVLAVLIWLVMVVMNVSLLVLFGMGKS